MSVSVNVATVSFAAPHQSWLESDRALTRLSAKINFRRMSSARPLLLLFRMLLGAALGVLCFAGIAMAHGDRHEGARQINNLAGHVSLTDAAMETARRSGIASVDGVVKSIEGRAIEFDASPCDDGPRHHHSQDGCCAVACHAAVAGLDAELVMPVGPLKVLVRSATTVLDGRSGDPGDRPPRSI